MRLEMSESTDKNRKFDLYSLLNEIKESKKQCYLLKIAHKRKYRPRTVYKRKGNYIAALKSGGKGKGNRKVAKDFTKLYVLDADGNDFIIDYDEIKNNTTQVTMK